MTQRHDGQRLARAGVAVLSAALASGAYYSSVVSPFVPIRISVVDREQTASRRVVAVEIPDTSALRERTAVLALRIRNGGNEPRRIGLLHGALPPQRVVVPPNETISWSIVLSSASVQALGVPPGGSPQILELTGDADVWSLIACEIRNYHARWGSGLMAVILPKSADEETAPTASSLVVFGLCLLGLLSAMVNPALRSGTPRVIGRGMTLAGLLVCATCVLLPRITPYRLMLSPSAFGVLTVALFSQVWLAVLLEPRALLTRISWKRHEVTYERGAALLGLTAIAIAQPIFEVVSNSPEFFPARSTTPGILMTAVVAVCVGFPLALLGIERAIRSVHAHAAAIFHGAVLMLLSAALVLPWLKRSEVVPFPWDILITAFAGLTIALAYAGLRVVRQLMIALAPAAIVVPLLFLSNRGVRQNFLASESASAIQSIARTPPIVFVVFDELPMNSLLDGTGEIDTVRYPNFGALARGAYWFRNASTVAYTTADAVPAILSGRYVATTEAVPTLRYYPVNLFTALARRYQIFASMRFQQLCPPRACRHSGDVADDSVPSLLSDLGLVWMHIVLPERLTEDLPPVVGEWAEFGRPREAAVPGGKTGRGAVFAEFLSAIDDRPARLHYIHMMLPHMPFEYVPSGRQYRAPDFQNIRYRGTLLFESASAAYADTIHQRHLAQVGYADRLIGDLVARLRQVGAYEDALIVITADHGASYREGRFRRQPRPQQHNLSDILQVPLVIKLPGQHRGEVVDRIVESVDILPTILDVVGARTSLRFDGRSLMDTRAPARTTFYLRNPDNRTPRGVGDLSADRAASLERKERRFGRGDFTALYAPTALRHWIGRNAGEPGIRAAADVHITVHNPRQFEAVDLNRDPLPIYVRGTLATSREAPVNIAVAVNGKVAAIAQSYQDRDGHMFGTLIPVDTLRNGNNVVTAFVLDDGRAGN